MHDKYGAIEEKPMPSVNRHRAAIQEAERTLFENDEYKKDGSILIRFGNL